MTTLIDSPEFSANEIYQIQQTDAVEGAASGATFGGIGVSNQPHQQLANRTALLKQRQDVNIAAAVVTHDIESLCVQRLGHRDDGRIVGRRAETVH
jgi:hypothetical protein